MPAGRPKKPLALKQLDGTYRKDRDGEAVVVKPKETKSPAPTSLKYKKAKDMWEYLSERFTSERMLTELDLPMLELMCVEYQRYLKYDREIAKNGEVITTKNPKNDMEYSEVNPYLKLREQALKRYTDLASKFGMTPSDRARVVKLDEKPKDDFEDL